MKLIGVVVGLMLQVTKSEASRGTNETVLTMCFSGFNSFCTAGTDNRLLGETSLDFILTRPFVLWSPNVALKYRPTNNNARFRSLRLQFVQAILVASKGMRRGAVVLSCVVKHSGFV